MEALLSHEDITREEFDELMAAIDQGLRALPATGQVSMWSHPLLQGMLNPFCGLSLVCETPSHASPPD